MEADDPWGDEPAWALEDEGAGGGDGDDGDGEDGPGAGAQHCLVLIDCSPAMFAPCVRVSPGDGLQTNRSDSQSTAPCGSSSASPGSGGGPGAGEGEGGGSSQIVVAPFEAALRAAERLLRQRVGAVATTRGGKRDGVGVLLYGTRRYRPLAAGRRDLSHRREARPLFKDDGGDSSDDDDDDDAQMLSMYELIPLAPPGTDQVLRMRGCIPGSCDGDGGGPVRNRLVEQHRRNLAEEFADLEGDNDVASRAARSMGQSTLCPLREAIHEANRIYMNASCVKRQPSNPKSPGDSRSIWLFTNADDPTRGVDEEKRVTVTTAKDAANNGIDIHLCPLPRADGTGFDRGRFFDSITAAADPRMETYQLEDEEGFSEGKIDLEGLLEEIDRHWLKVRKAHTLPLLLPGWENRSGTDPGIMLDLFRHVVVKRKPMAVTVHQGTNKRTEKKTDILGTDGDAAGAIIDPTQLRSFVEFGGARVPLTAEDVRVIRRKSNANKGTASLILVGFKPIASMPRLTFQDSYFAYPNEEKVTGSGDAFAALLASMLRKEVIAIGELLLRATASSRLVAIVPQAEYHSEDGRQTKPPGLLIFQLPFEDDIRSIEDDCGETADEDLVEAAVELVKHQRIHGVEWGVSFENPALAEFWNYIESIAIGIPLQRADNEVEIDSDAILAAAGAQIEALRIALPEDEVKVKKRKAATQPDESDIDWIHLYKTDSLSDCSATKLKNYLRSIGEKLTGRKADLLERVRGSVEERIKKGDVNSGPADASKEEEA